MNKTELKEAISGLVEELGLDVGSIDGMNVSELKELYKDLKAKKSDADTVTAADQAVGNYVVSKGKSITSLKGILSEGCEVKAEYFKGGAEALKSLVEYGVIEKL
jgi:hypothetical protein|tara:strand:- start:9421 stop:9735 length:315 start_codon:yes stop_codon:yes gene_type:complete